MKKLYFYLQCLPVLVFFYKPDLSILLAYLTAYSFIALLVLLTIILKQDKQQKTVPILGIILAFGFILVGGFGFIKARRLEIERLTPFRDGATINVENTTSNEVIKLTLIDGGVFPHSFKHSTVFLLNRVSHFLVGENERGKRYVFYVNGGIYHRLGKKAVVEVVLNDFLFELNGYHHLKKMKVIKNTNDLPDSVKGNIFQRVLIENNEVKNIKDYLN